MDVAAKLTEARIVRVAIIDDDLSVLITEEQLRAQSASAAAILNDRGDEDRAAYVAQLTALGRPVATMADLVSPLAEEPIRTAAPVRLRTAAEQLLAARAQSAEPVRAVIELLKTLGISGANIEIFSEPTLPHDQYFDLIIVDYFLVDVSTDATLPLIEEAIDAHVNQDRPLQVILMSSHGDRLREDFKTIRPKLKVSSSRMRIMEKPTTPAHQVAWQAALYQLASDRGAVPTLERFISETGTALKRAADAAALKLWEIDLQAMDLLHELAANDHDDYARYVEDAVSRGLLYELEQDGGMRTPLRLLDEGFATHRSEKLLAPPAEIGDSRAAIHDMMRSMEWRGGVLALPLFPNGQPMLDRATWIRKQVRFGMVLQDPEGTYWLNITQACDLAQAKDPDLGRSTILFVRGKPELPATPLAGEYVVPMSAMMAQSENHVLTWNLRDLRAESIENFSDTYGGGWQVVGELRPDKAQSIAVQFGSRMARVGLPVTLAAWRLSGVAMRVVQLRAAPADAPLAGGLVLTGQAVQRSGSKHELHLDRASLDALLALHGDALDAGILQLLMGLALKPGTLSDLASRPVVVYCATPPANGAEGRQALKNEGWLNGGANAERIVVLLWSAN